MNERIKIDFEVIETKSPKKLMVGDSSRWFYSEELPAYIYITVPGTSNEIEYPFNKHSIEIFDSVSLNLNCEQEDECGDIVLVDLPDGVYKIKVQSGFRDILKEKYYLKTDILTRELSRKLADKVDKNDSNFIEAVFKVWYLLEVSKSYVIKSDIPNTKKYYNEALEALKCL